MVADIIGVVVAILVVAGFVYIVRWRTRQMSSRTTRTAEDMYDDYADPPVERRRGIRRTRGPKQPPTG